MYINLDAGKKTLDLKLRAPVTDHLKRDRKISARNSAEEV
jgi:hypothetical protein